MKNKLSLYLILFAVYCLFVFSPFMIQSLNQIVPTLFGMPFTFWFIHGVIILGCLLLYWGSKNAWDSFDDSLEGGERP